MADLLDALADALAALQAIPNAPPVLLRGVNEDPGGDEVIVLDRVASTGLQMQGGSATTNRIQVTCYAAGVERALDLTAQARAALGAQRFTFIQSRPAPDGVGELADYRRG
ncbi:hypothetical protein DAETH_28930 [Deinococcus aetherius]|uniref:Uncharacterized protein n=1 Tax=Deinococcus aetherius TaxID=200252 RepID=A0ABM8AGJ7_9DEIO|nr:hypothetical protein [Deinococcus aetherius]BDP42924.1 hypothetical protein DAETH_28930 [Deinococcus aetherius]